MSENERLIVGLRWMTLSNLLSFLLSLAQTALLARLLSKSDFAWVAIAAVFVNIGLHLQNAGINAAIIQQSHLTHRQLSTLYWFNWLIGCALWIIGVGVAWLAGSAYQSSDLQQIFMWYNLTFVINAVGVQYKTLLQKEFRFRALALIEGLASTLGFTTAVLAAWLGWGALALVGSYLVKCGVESLLSVGVGIWSWRPAWHFYWREIRTHRQFGAAVTAERLVTLFVTQLDVLLISRWLGADATGVYDVFKRVLARPSVLLNISIEKVAFPIFADLKQKQQLTPAYVRLLRLSSAVHLPTYGLAAITANWLVHWYFGGDWTAQVVVFQLLCLWALAHAWLNPIESLLLAVGKIQWQLALYLLMAPVLAGAVWLGHFWGLSGATAGIVAVQFIFAALAYKWLFRNGILQDRKQLWTAIEKPLLLTIASSIVAMPVFLLSQPLVAIGLFLIAYAGLVIRYDSVLLTFTKAFLKKTN